MMIGGASTSTASVITLHPICFFPSTSPPATSGNIKLIRRKQRALVLCSLFSSQNDPKASEVGISSKSSFRRRDAVLQMAFSAVVLQFSSILSPALSADDVPPDFRLYSDDVNKYQMLIPQDWQVGAGQTDGVRSLTAFYPDEAASASNVSVLITGIGPDFTRLESFGKVDAFAENLVSGLDRSWQRPPGEAAKLIDCKSSNGLYYIEYTLQKPGESLRHIYSAIGMANNGWYNRLYTVTGQYVEEEADKFGSKIQKAVQSFRLNKTQA